MSGRRPRRLDVDGPALGRGALLGVAVGVAAAVLARLLDGLTDATAPLVVPLLLVLAGLAAGGRVAARRCARAPLVNAAGAALAAVVLLLVANLIRRVVAGDDVAWVYVAAWTLLAVACGLTGGLLALRGPRRR